MVQTADQMLEFLRLEIDPRIDQLNFLVQRGEQSFSRENCSLSISFQQDDLVEFAGVFPLGELVWNFRAWQGGYQVQLMVRNHSQEAVYAISNLVFQVSIPANEAVRYVTPRLSMDGVQDVGIQKLAANEKIADGSLMKGLFKDAQSPGLFMATLLPQKHVHQYWTEWTTEDHLTVHSRTDLVQGVSHQAEVSSECTWLCARYPLRQAIDTYASHLPVLPAEKRKPAIGYNSWDYYFSTVSLFDIMENMEEIRHDPILREAVQYMVIDMGWEYRLGEWESNYRFPGGLQVFAEEVQRQGFIPGVWTAPLLVEYLCKTALRYPEMLVKDQYGDPVKHGNHILDPSHPASQAFLRRLYRGLYDMGFRLFKVDFVSELLSEKIFYDKSKGPYELIADLFALIRDCVGPESHIIGCSLPIECGPGCADSLRLGIDIHNHWEHVKWATEFYSLLYWCHERICANDIDFLVVRGSDTSLEAETNVLFADANNPNPGFPRWRQGPVFNTVEAKTWASMVHLSGGNVFLSDRLRMLNEEGRGILRKVITPFGEAAVPLDLGDDEHPRFWLMEKNGEKRLGLINWGDETAEMHFDPSLYRLALPVSGLDLWSGKSVSLLEGELCLTLPPHGAAIIIFS